MKTLWLTLAVAMLAAAAAGWEAARVQPAAAQAAADLYMKDTPLDTGVEPNPDTGPMWVTEDVWVRTTADPNYRPQPFPESSPSWTPLPHENPEYRDPKYGLPNYVYVRVRNRGGTPSSGTERLRVYWAKASTGLAWPTQWVDYLANNCGPTDLYGAEVTKPRKNAATATAAERIAYRDAIVGLGTTPGFVFPGGVSYWHKQDEVHQLGPGNRHNSPAFLPWHREFINRYEVLLQEANPTVKLLYWDWTTDPENSTGGFNLFTASFMGASGRGTGGVSAGLPFIPPLSPPAVTRNLSPSTTTPADADATLLANATYPLFRSSNENVPNHNSAHGYIGGGGNMSFISSAAEDPFFFMLHANADRLWAQWQRNPANLTRLEPATAYDTNSGNVNITTNMAPWDGTGTSIRPWTVADGYIVSKSPKHPSVVSPPIYDTAPLVIPSLQPGEAVIIEVPWYPPNPADFACFGGDQGHFCLLARIETAISAPFGMTTPEGASVYANTRNNNNIAWKNITVVDNFPGALRLASALIRNVQRQRALISLRFADTEEIGASFFDFGRILVDLKPELFRRWQENGGAGQGIEPVGGSVVQILAPDAFIQNIPLEPEEAFSIDIRFELLRDYRLPRGVTPKWDVIQTTAVPGAPAAIVGGQRFELEFKKLTLVEAGEVWRYLDDGSDPGARWTAPDYSDDRWKLGRAELGFGDDPVTTINGGPPERRHITTYFRRAFDVADPSFYRSLVLRLKRDDGAAVYLNGTQIHRVNLPRGSVTPDMLAEREVDGLEEEVFFPVDVTGALELLRRGRNVLAVEIHQDSVRSPDLSFDLELAANHASPRFAPSVAFAEPTNGALFQVGQAIPIAVEALDGDGQIQMVAVFVDGERLGVADGPPYTFRWTNARVGIHRLRAVARDNDQEQATADLTIRVVENTPPSVEITAPSDGAVFHVGEVIRFAAKATDVGGDVRRVEFHVRDADLFVADERLIGSVAAPPFTLERADLAPGHYMLIAVARDNGGEASQSMPIHFQVHGMVPRARLFLPHLAAAHGPR